MMAATPDAAGAVAAGVAAAVAAAGEVAAIDAEGLCGEVVVLEELRRVIDVAEGARLADGPPAVAAG